MYVVVRMWEKRAINYLDLPSLSFCGYICFFHAYVNTLEQAKPETVEKVCKIVKKQLAMPETDVVTGESKFATLGADSLDTVIRNIIPAHNIFPINVHFIYLPSYICHDT